MPSNLQNVVNVTSYEELERVRAGATGPVVLDFWEDGCPSCEDEAPKLQEIAASNPNLTVIKVELAKECKENDEKCARASKTAEDLGDQWGVQQFPTLFFAESGASLAPGRAQELTDSSELRERLSGTHT